MLVSKFLFGESIEVTPSLKKKKNKPPKAPQTTQTNPTYRRLNVFNYFLSSKASSGYYVGVFTPAVAGGFACLVGGSLEPEHLTHLS